MPDRLQDLQKIIEAAIDKFNGRIPSVQTSVLEALLEELKELDVRNRSVLASVKNIRLIARIKNKLQEIILTKDYIRAVREYIQVFDEVARIQNEYFKSTEARFKPSAIAKEVRKQSITDVVNKLTEAGIGVNIGDEISSVLKQAVSSGSSYKDLTNQLREMLTKTRNPGLLERYTRQVTTDAVNQYSAQYMENISSDLGYEWFRYAGRDIETTRHFCDAMTDLGYFHVSQIPALLQAKNLYYTDPEGVERKVPINSKTGLPNGMIPGTNASNFMIRRGGYNCRHQILPVIERLVPNKIKKAVFESAAYKRWTGER